MLASRRAVEVDPDVPSLFRLDDATIPKVTAATIANRNKYLFFVRPMRGSSLPSSGEEDRDLLEISSL